MSDDIRSASANEGDPPEPPSPTEKASPSDNTARAGQYYRVDGTRASFVELWRDARSPLVLLAWLIKLLRIKLPGTINDPNVVSLRPFLVKSEGIETSIPDSVQEKVGPVVRELIELGFGKTICFLVHDRFHQGRICQLAMLHRDGRSVARINHRLEGVRIHFFTEFISALSDGTFVESSSASAQMLRPPQSRLNWNHQATTSQLWVSHQQKLEQDLPSGTRVITISNRAEMLDVLEGLHEVIRDFHLARGLFSPMKGKDLERATALDRKLDQGDSGQVEFPEVMVHLEQIQKKKINWGSAFWVLIISAFVFLGAGKEAWGQPWQIMLIILGVLFVHEAGHYLAMRIFRYRNVRMFFIPLFGAAVTGQNYTAPGWKKVIVSLMGPLPGLIAGGALGVMGFMGFLDDVQYRDTMMTVALWAVILNGMQLVPLLPLDGGHVVHTVLFSRNCYVDTVFRTIAAVAIFVLGLAINSWLMMAWGVFMFFGISLAHKLGSIAAELRRERLGLPGSAHFIAQPVGVAGAMPQGSAGLAQPPEAEMFIPGGGSQHGESLAAEHGEDRTIPQPVAEEIIRRIRARLPMAKSAQQLATMTLRVYETVAERPPGAIASIAFMLLHGVAIAATLVLMSLLMFLTHPEADEMIAMAQATPVRELEPDAISSHYSTLEIPPDTEDRQKTIVATFDTVGQAREFYEQARQQASGHTSAVLFGQSVLLSLPPRDETARKEWLAQLDKVTNNTFVDDAKDHYAVLILECCEPFDQNVHQQLGDFWNIPAPLCLIPPWAGKDVDRRTEAERAEHVKTRAMFVSLSEAFPTETPEMESISQEMSRALERGDDDEFERLRKRHRELSYHDHLRELHRLHDETRNPVLRNLAKRYIALEIEKYEKDTVSKWEGTEEEKHDWRLVYYESYAREREQLAPMMGRLPLEFDHAPISDRKYSTTYGYLQHAGDGILLRATFDNLAYGAPALVRWLHQQGCHDFHYELVSNYDDY